jgi:hypothetical protein
VASGRLEIRVDAELQEKLAAIARQRGRPLSAVVREMIDRAYEDVAREERLAAAYRPCRARGRPRSSRLSRQLDERRGRYRLLSA